VIEMKKIKITISKDGGLSIEADGFSDKTCLNHLKILEDLFGEASDVKLKPEFNVTTKNKNLKA